MVRKVVCNKYDKCMHAPLVLSNRMQAYLFSKGVELNKVGLSSAGASKTKDCMCMDNIVPGIRQRKLRKTQLCCICYIHPVLLRGKCASLTEHLTWQIEISFPFSSCYY